ncbi:TPA: hypothetical protein ACGIK9_003414 [Acinetobacter baumannii]|uniref:hypothetical protein n=1 Tax=Acinetobacter baumannii TaxID=470 RepID=UPI00338E62E0
MNKEDPLFLKPKQTLISTFLVVMVAALLREINTFYPVFDVISAKELMLALVGIASVVMFYSCYKMMSNSSDNFIGIILKEQKPPISSVEDINSTLKRELKRMRLLQRIVLWAMYTSMFYIPSVVIYHTLFVHLSAPTFEAAVINGISAIMAFFCIWSHTNSKVTDKILDFYAANSKR